MSEVILKMQNITKLFGVVRALEDVQLECQKGEVHVLAGENGAGKSTILKILMGVYKPDEGTIELFGKPVKFKKPQDAQNAGVAMVFQELTLINELTVLENVFLNNEESKAFIINKKKQRALLEETLKEYGIDISPDTIVDRLSVAEKQLIEIIKVVIRDAELIILDEPTSSLAKGEVEILFSLIRKLTKVGKTIVFISHRLEEVFEIGDRITVFKDGSYIATENLKDLDVDQLIRLMVGRELKNIFPPLMEDAAGEAVLEIKDLKITNQSKPINFTVNKGEVIGVAGLQGHGQTELLNAISGLHSTNGGKVILNGKEIDVKTCRKALDHGIALIPGDRKQEGLMLNMTIRHNMAVASMEKRQTLGFINERAEKSMVADYQKKLRIKMHNMEQEVGELSGGNQQKVVLGKELAIDPKVILFNEPTRGIDVEAKHEFYLIMRDLAKSGTAVVMCSNDLMEIIGMSDRVIVMYDMNITSILNKEQISEENIMRCAMGLPLENRAEEEM